MSMGPWDGPKTDGTDLATQADLGVLNTGAFRAYRAAALNCTGTTTPIVFDTESFDTSNWYNTSNGRYTPQIAGYYHFTVFAGIAAMSSSGNYFQLYLWKNGGGASQLFLCQHAGYPNYPRGGGSDIIYLNGSGDYVQIAGFQSSGSNKAYDTGADNTYFTGHRVG